MTRRDISLWLEVGCMLVIDGAAMRVVDFDGDEIQLSTPGAFTDRIKTQSELSDEISEAEQFAIYS